MLPPAVVAGYARGHDEAILEAAARIRGAGHVRPLTADQHWATRVLQLPHRMGGLGLRSSERTSPAAFVAGWLDVLPTLGQRFPWFAESFLAALGREAIEEVAAASPALGELRGCVEVLRGHGFETPAWAEVVQGLALPPPERELRGRARRLGPRLAVLCKRGP